ncbi:unnamed protein product [Amoebophrya sp. A25]|nr:unnamed protein product [Amoebophrya sp. A25]|eukprot:GSA25T00006444001.1
MERTTATGPMQHSSTRLLCTRERFRREGKETRSGLFQSSLLLSPQDLLRLPRSHPARGAPSLSPHL